MKSKKSSFPRRRESRPGVTNYKHWIPVSTLRDVVPSGTGSGMTKSGVSQTFYRFIMLERFPMEGHTGGYGAEWQHKSRDQNLTVSGHRRCGTFRMFYYL